MPKMPEVPNPPASPCSHGGRGMPKIKDLNRFIKKSQ
jgi:hypothetical protein